MAILFIGRVPFGFRLGTGDSAPGPDLLAFRARRSSSASLGCGRLNAVRWEIGWVSGWAHYGCELCWLWLSLAWLIWFGCVWVVWLLDEVAWLG